ncbi:magnesium transporter [Vagococcus elongatus]|uniref:Magnesium transporter MgtE n=1 Tax=Vagococcus elongatus TaxID=180344 RepID=A0A430B494_9ENTE|nr:magnesium transporter [Vagococcus elongatus]RSU15128.1 magnesium transporter [Vagococcus elongatus]
MDEEMLVSFPALFECLQQDQLNEFRDIFFDLHVYEQGQFYLSLDAEDRQKLYTYLSPQEMANMFDVIEEDQEDVDQLLKEMDPNYASDMLTFMFTDNAVDTLNQLDKKDVSMYLSIMEPESAKEIKNLLHYEDDTAGSIMTTEYVAVEAEQTVASALQYLKKVGREAEIIYYIFVTDEDGFLVGVISLRDLIVSDEEELIKDVMSERVVSVKVGDDQEDVARMIRDYDFLAMPVTDYRNRLLGIITVDDIIDVIDEEAASDYSGLAGVDVEEVADNPFQSAAKRLPWLVTLLVLSMSTATLIGHYEALVSKASILAVFISLITGTAGNAGTQSLAVAVRRLALQANDRSFFRLILAEILTGLITGLITGFTICVLVGVWKQNFMLGFVIGFAMMCAITVANLAGSLIPMVMDKLGFDPAVASGPFITTLSDLTSVLIYFNIAGIFMQYFIK